MWFAREEDGVWSTWNPGAGINTAGPEFNACIHPDGTRVLFSSVREGDQGGGDLYASDLVDGTWQPARALTALNSSALDYCPSFSADGRWLWFTSRRRDSFLPVEDLETLRAGLGGPGNGNDDLFVVSAESVD